LIPRKRLIRFPHGSSARREAREELSAKGVTFVQEQSDRPYGIEAVMRDISGSWLVLVEPKDFKPERLP